jgi:hypothetical protein
MVTTPSWHLGEFMEQVFAQVNHGRWIVICPRCQSLGIISAAEVATDETMFVCPEEYPATHANMLIPHPRQKGAFLSAPDKETRKQARQTAIDIGDAYEIVFPAEKTEIERLLRYRPRAARNWYPGVSVEELKTENERMGVHHA